MHITQLDKQTFVLSAASHLIYAVMEMSGIVNLLKNIVHLFHVQRSL